jgi:excisionase family DNA binding protein
LLALLLGVAVGVSVTGIDRARCGHGRGAGRMTPHAAISGTHAGKDLPLLSTVDETAALLRTTRKGIYSMIERGQLPGVTRIGRRVLIRTPDLLDWLRQKSTPSLER